MVSGTHVKPRSVHALNETTFLGTYSSEILAEDIGSAIKKISEWLDKPVVITYDEVTAAQLPQVIEHASCTAWVESVVFNTGLDEMRTDSNPSIHSGYHNYAGGPVVPGALGTMLLNKMPGIAHFSGSEREKDTVRFEQWLYSISDARRHFSEQLVRAAIKKSCVGNAANAICCLMPGMTLDDIIEKFKWLYGSVESFKTLMQEFYRIVQGRNESIQAFVLCLEWALKAIKQQHSHAMTEQEGEHHLKDQLFHGLRSNIQNALHYMYNKPNSQYSKIVMTARKAETETLGSGVLEDRTKSAVVELDTQPKSNSSEPPYEAIMQQCTSCLLLPIRMQVIIEKMVWDLTAGMENFLIRKSQG